MTSSQRLQRANTARLNRERAALSGWTPEESLSAEDQQEKSECVEIVNKGFKVWYEVGEALLRLRDKRLYRDTHKTFEDFCRDHWQMSKTNANRLIAGSEVIANLTPIGVIPVNEAQARELVPYEPQEQRLIAKFAELVIGPNPTAADYKSLGIIARDGIRTGAIDNGEGEDIPLSQASIMHVKAAFTEETYERMKRQEAHIAEKQARRAGVPVALQASENNEWYTPGVYLEAVRAVLGAVDVDPASNAEANEIVQAATFYDIHDDGLSHDWTGKVFLNPPYGRDGISNQERWSHRLMEQYAAGITTEAILLVNAVTERVWFQPLWDYPICFTDHRIPFYRPGGVPGQPVIGSAFVYFGKNPDRFAAVFRKFGAVVLRVVRGDDDGSSAE